MAAPRHYTFICGSETRECNSETLARRAAAGLAAADVLAWLYLSEMTLPPFSNRRDVIDPSSQPAGDEKTLFDNTLACTDLIFVAPLYWYPLPMTTRRYLDLWSTWQRIPSVHFKSRMAGKNLWVICSLTDRDPTKAGPLVVTIKEIAAYLGMCYCGALLENGSRRGDVLKDKAAIAAANLFFGNKVE